MSQLCVNYVYYVSTRLVSNSVSQTIETHRKAVLVAREVESIRGKRSRPTWAEILLWGIPIFLQLQLQAVLHAV